MSCQRANVCVCVPLWAIAYLLGRKVLHNICTGKRLTIYNATKQFGTPLAANKINLIKARSLHSPTCLQRTIDVHEIVHTKLMEVPDQH